MNASSQIPSIFSFLNEQLPESIGPKNPTKKLHTNISLLSEKSDLTKNRIPTINKDYSFVNFDPNPIQENDKQQDQIQESTHLLKNHIFNQDSLDTYKKWIAQSRKIIAKNQGTKLLQQCIQVTPPQLIKPNQMENPPAQQNLKNQNTQKRQKSMQKIDKNDPNIKDQLKSKQSHYYVMLQISSISDVIWAEFDRLLHNSQDQASQLYCRLSISLEEENNCFRKQFPKKIITDLIRLQRRQTNDRKTGALIPSSYFTDEKFCVYFHTQNQWIQIIIQIILYDVKKYRNLGKADEQQIKRQAQVVIREQYFSFMRIPVNIKRKNKSQQDLNKMGQLGLMNLKKEFQKYENINLNQNFLRQRKSEHPSMKLDQKAVAKVIRGQERDQNSYGVLNFNVINSEYYKILSKLIPTEYIVWHKDLIPGLLGSHLPKVDDSLFHISPSTQSKSLYLDLENLELQTEWINKAQLKASQKFEAFKIIQSTSNISSYKTFYQFKEISLSLIFHNGIKQVNKVSLPLAQKMEIQKRIQKQSVDRITSKLNFQLQKNHLLVPIKIFGTSPFFMPQIFYQPNCFIIMQIYQKLEIKETQSTVLNSQKIRQFLIPVAFAFFEPEKILSNKSMDTKLYEGWYLDGYNFERAKAIKSAKNMVLNTLNNILESRNNIHSYKENFQNQELILSKASVICSLKEPQFDETWYSVKNKLEESLLLNNQGLGASRSVLLNNEEARIDAEKEKVLKKMSSVLVNLGKGTRKQMKKIRIRDEIVLLQNPESLYYSLESQPNRKVQRKQINDMKDFLKRQLGGGNLSSQSVSNPNNIISKVLAISQKPSSGLIQKVYKYSYNESDIGGSHCFKSYNQIFQSYDLKAKSIILPSHSCWSPSLAKMFYNNTQIQFLTNSNNNPYSRVTQNNSVVQLDSNDNLSQYGYESTPIEIIRTQLAQVNYNYLILINPISLRPLQTANNSFFTIPNKFFLKIYFWNMENSQSPCFQLDPQTGQIVVFIEKVEKKQQPKRKNSISKELIKMTSKAQLSKRQIQTKNQLDYNKMKLKKVFHFQYGSEEEYSNSKELFLQFVDYLYNGLMEIRLYDQFQQIGRTYLKLRSLLRKRKNQTSTIIDDFIYSKSGPICQIKLQCKSLRKEKPPKRCFQDETQVLTKNLTDKGGCLNLTKKTSEEPKQYKQITLNQNKESPSKSSLNLQNQSEILQQLNHPSIDLSLVYGLIQSIQSFTQIDKQQQRIQRFKKLKQLQTQIKPPFQSKQKQAIHKLIQKNYLASQYKFKVFSYQKTYFFIQLENRSNKKAFFCLNATDDDYPFYKDTFPDMEIKLIRNFHSQLPQNDKERILAVQSNRQKLLKYRKLNENFEIQLQDKQKLLVICQYQSKRRYCPQDTLKNKAKNKQFLKSYNHNHTITISLLEAVNQSTVSSISKLHIFPEPSHNLIQIEETVKISQRSILCLPFLLSSVIKQKYDIYINKNRCNIICQQSMQNQDERVFNSTHMSNQRQKYNQSPKVQKAMLDSRPGEEQDWKAKFDKNVSIFGDKNKDFIQDDDQASPTFNRTKQMTMTGQKNLTKTLKLKQLNFISIFFSQKQSINSNSQQMRQQVIKNKKLSAILVPKDSRLEAKSIMIQIAINSVETQQIMKVPLFEPIKTTIKIHHNSLLGINGRMPKVVGVICQSHEFKMKEMWVQLDKDKSFTEVEFKFTSTMYGSRSFAIIVVDALKYSIFYKNAIKSEAVIQQLQKSYLHRILYTVMSPFPSLKAQLVISLPLNYVSTKQGYEELFTYTNSTVHNIVFHIYTSHPWFLCVEEKDKVCEVKAKSQKQLKLKINVRRLTDDYIYALKGQGSLTSKKNSGGRKLMNPMQTWKESSRDLLPVIMLSFVSDRVVEHFGIGFKIS